MKRLTIELTEGKILVVNEGFTNHEILGIIEVMRVRTVTDTIMRDKEIEQPKQNEETK